MPIQIRSKRQYCRCAGTVGLARVYHCSFKGSRPVEPFNIQRKQQLLGDSSGDADTGLVRLGQPGNSGRMIAHGSQSCGRIEN